MIRALRFLVDGVAVTMSLAMLAAITAYRLLLSPLMPHVCRFEPSCSKYAIGAIQRHGPVIGAWRTAKRIARCHPWNPGGWDPP